MQYKVKKEEANKRLDKYIAEVQKNISRSLIQKLIDDEKVTVNDKVKKASFKVFENDIVKFEIPEPKVVNIIPQNIELNIIYEDDDILVVNKQKGLVVHPGNGNLDGTLVNAVMAHCKESLSGIGGEIRPGIVHRLDKDTSGVIVVAKNDYSHNNLSAQIKNREVKKTYIALVRGNVTSNEATIDMPIARHKNLRTKMAVDIDGKNAITHFKVLKRFEKFTLLEVNIETGRTHQIRVHLSEIGYPVVGDEIYSNGKNPFDVKGQMLHAKTLVIKHPRTGKEIVLEAELPEYFKQVLEKLEYGEKYE